VSLKRIHPRELKVGDTIVLSDDVRQWVLAVERRDSSQGPVWAITPHGGGTWLAFPGDLLWVVPA